MSPKIIINGKEIDTANLPPNMRELSRLSPELQQLLEDKDGNGVPDIADNPFAMLGKLGQISSLAQEMPVLMSKIKNPAEKKELAEFVAEEIRQAAGSGKGSNKSSGTGSGGQNSTPGSASAAVPSRQKQTAQDWASASPPIKKDTGRKVLFWLMIAGLIGWYFWPQIEKFLDF